VKLVRLRRPKATCLSSFVNYRPKTNAEILWEMGYNNRRLCLVGRVGVEGG
jgi:hypothetical protein